MATPSSKPNPGATPTHLTSSPHPSAVPMGRPLSHKSPSIKTPSASGHGHGQQTSASSHQYATPLAANASLDDASPSALLALGAFAGISPSPAVQDGLVGPGMNEGDIHALGMQALGLGGPRDPNEERRKNIEEVVQLLRTRVAGRGVSREAVERLGQLEGFESIWQEHSLSIAGNSVDLEIEFYPGEDNVKDVSLKYATPDAQEGERRDDATAVLKRDLVLSPEERERGVWKSLSGFHANLERLARLDKLSQEVNCFEAVEGLYESLRRIWEEESKRGMYQGTYEHLCRGSIGRPTMHKGGRVGMGLEYWVEQHRLLDSKHKQLPSDAVDQGRQDALEDNSEDRLKLRSVTIECEAGFPSLRVSKDWVGEEVLTAVNANAPSSSNGSSESDIMLVNWVDPLPTLVSSVNGNQADPMAVDSGMVGSGTPNRRFVARLEPPVDVPILAASDIYRHLGLQLPQEFKPVTYDGLLVPGWTSAADEGSAAPVDSPHVGGRRRRKSVLVFDSNGQPVRKHHTYTFQAFEAVAGRTLRDLPFSHPRQLADIFPILRQYGLLATLIQKIFPPPSNNGDDAKQTSKRKSETSRDVNTAAPGLSRSKDNHITVLSNDDPNEDLLNFLLDAPADHDASELFSDDTLKSAGTLGRSSLFASPLNDDVRVDITLRTQIGQAPLIMLLFTVMDTESRSSEPSSNGLDVKKISINFEIGPNGRVTVTQLSGLVDGESTSSEDSQDDQTTGGPKAEVREMQNKLSRVLETSEDLGMLVELVLGQLQKKKHRA
ncbi:hypothetical protein VTN77DRAFT_3936 [Rasamsonia byssochlamydoides]|uniref:uncharacterized protein n=1 Tax=Rasamsonia byssochlamydoides TaxID=89139 RepID=UPI003742AFD7